MSCGVDVARRLKPTLYDSGLALAVLDPAGTDQGPQSLPASGFAHAFWPARGAP